MSPRSAEPGGAVEPRAGARVREAPAADGSRRRSLVLLAVLVLGVASRVVSVGRPLDHRSLAPWRESDYTQLARNFYRDGLDIRYPKIDWRRDTPGYAEMELPIVPWAGAVLDRALGYHEQLLRLPAALASMLGLLVFVGLSRRVLPPGPALLAIAAFAANPLLVYLGSVMQPDPLMVLLSLLAVALLWRWEDAPRPATLLAASAVTAAAILAKSPAAVLGPLFAYTVIRRLGWRAFTSPAVHAAALVALAPPLAWYAWAARFWHLYGNSLGVSNESHFIGWDMLFPPRFLVGIVKWETLGVFTPAGWLLALAALRWRQGRLDRVLAWYGSVCLFYLVTARTSGDNWSFYYHCISVAPGCLLIGAGAAAFAEAGVLPSAVASASRQRWIGGLLAGATLVSLVAATGVLLHRRDSHTEYLDMRTCALELLPHVGPSDTIVVDGGAMFDEYGHPVAHNASMFFAWMDRKGFNYGTEELSFDTLDRIAAHGGRYWIAGDDELRGDHSRDAADRRYRAVARCAHGYSLYDLRSTP